MYCRFTMTLLLFASFAKAADKPGHLKTSGSIVRLKSYRTVERK